MVANLMEASGHQRAQLSRPCSPTIIIGLGEYGRQVLIALDLASLSRPHVQKISKLWVGFDGWSSDWDCGTQLETWPDPGSWWEEHGEKGTDQIQTSVLKAMRSAESGAEALDIYIVAHLHESFARHLWPLVLEISRSAHVPFTDHTFTLIFAIDSLAFPVLPTHEARAIQANINLLVPELLTATNEQEPPGRVGWCYFLDTLDTHAHPIRALNHEAGDESNTEKPTHSVDHRNLQAHMVAEFVTLLYSGLRCTPAYRRTSLADIARHFRGQAPAAWVSTFSASSLVLPVSIVAECARDSLAFNLLNDFVIGREKPGDLPSAQKIRSRWLAECSLSPLELRARIARDRSGQPFIFPVEPPRLDGLPDELCVDHLLNWDTILWERWNRADSLPEQMTQNAAALLEEGTSWLEHQIDDLVQHKIGGIRLGKLFLREASKALDEEKHKPDTPIPVEEHWFTALLAPLRPHPPDPTALPDLQTSCRKLEAALSKRFNRRAVWVRASLFGAAILAFLWPAFLASGMTLGFTLSSVFPSLLTSIPVQALDFGILLVFCLSLTFLAGWLKLYRSEKNIHTTVDKLILDIRHKYTALMERTLRVERKRIYEGLQAELSKWSQIIDTRMEILVEARTMLESDLHSEFDPAPLLTEQFLLESYHWSALLPRLELATCRGISEGFLNLPDRPAWPSETEAVLRADLRRFAEAQLQDWRAGLDLDSWAAKPDTPGPLEDLLAELRSSVRPAWPLSREERSRLGARLKPPAPPGYHHVSISPVLVSNFIGLPADGNKEPVYATKLTLRDDIFSTSETGRLAYVPTLHALELNHLHALKLLQAKAVVKNDGKEAVDVGRLADQTIPAQDDVRGKS